MDGKTRVCGVIANPVEHSLSPLLQNLYAERTGVNLAYVPFKVKEEQLEEAVKGAYALNLLGLNVTVPHKQAVMKYLVEIDQTAADIGAVNTLVRVEGGFKGYNTDVPGLTRAVKEEKIRMEGRSCILIGAGGAAKAAAYMLAKEGAGVIYLLNRSVEKAEALAAWVNRLSGRGVVKPLALTEYESIPGDGYFAIQCTNVGMHPRVDAAPVEDAAFYRKISEAYDCIYTPAETKFMRLVKKAGGRAVNGLNMLLYQGVISYELWNPQVKVKEDAIAAARELLQRRLGIGAAASEEKKNSGDIILIGFMGAGKTTVGQALAKSAGMAFADTDQMIEKKAGKEVKAIFSEDGEETFRRMETGLLRQLLQEKEEKRAAGKPKKATVYSVGGGLPMREENRELLKQLGRVVYLTITPDTVLTRLKGDTTRPLLAGTNVRERVEALLSLRDPLYREASHVSVATDGKALSRIVEEILVDFRQNQP